MSNYTFSQVPKSNIPRSTFDRSSGVKCTFDAGQLIPFFVDECVPGDTFNLRTSGFARLATPLYPIMDNMYMDTHYFAVPMRLVWENFTKMMGEQENPGDSTDYRVPLVTPPTGGFAEGSLADYMGIPTGVENLEVSALPFRCLNLIYNEWFRDQNLIDSLDVPKGDGPDLDTTYTIQRRGKRHDYFTSSLPWTQKGPEQTIPLGTTANIQTSVEAGTATPDGYMRIMDSTGTMSAMTVDTTGDGLNISGSATTGTLLTADLTNASAATINQLRQAFQIQKMYERDARSGSRYTEIIQSHFNTTNPLVAYRPEYLGGSSTPVNINPVTATADNRLDDATEGRSLGAMGAMGTASFQGNGFTKSFTEHTIVIGFVSVRADMTYQQGLNRMWSRRDRLDFYWPSLAQIGEQAVLNKEIYADGSAADEEAFGYQERFAEMRYKPSLVTSQFRSSAATPLDSWHLAQEFDSLPTLNQTFIEENPPVDRVIQTPEEPHFIADFWHSLRCARPMPLYGVPGNIDRF